MQNNMSWNLKRRGCVRYFFMVSQINLKNALNHYSILYTGSYPMQEYIITKAIYINAYFKEIGVLYVNSNMSKQTEDERKTKVIFPFLPESHLLSLNLNINSAKQYIQLNYYHLKFIYLKLVIGTRCYIYSSIHAVISQRAKRHSKEILSD